MRIKLTGGVAESGVVVGNAFDKYNSRNPLVNLIMKRFQSDLDDLVRLASPRDIHEVGCGEGFWTLRWLDAGYEARGSDFSSIAITLAQSNSISRGFPSQIFKSSSIYDLDTHDSADLIVCCEVLEHLEDPDLALKKLKEITRKYLIVSVPREPVWRVLNFFRGKYIADFGNTPGHIQHWSKRGLIKLVSSQFEIVEVRNPLPWTMVLCKPK